MEDGSASSFWQLHLDAIGAAIGLDPATLIASIAASDVTDLFVMSHGWNNSEGSAEALYAVMFPLIAEASGVPRKAGYLGVFWPSIWFPDPPSGDADSALSGTRITASLASSLPAATNTLSAMGNLIDEGVKALGTATRQQQDTAVDSFHQHLQSVFAGTTVNTQDAGERFLIDSDNPKRDYAALAEKMRSEPLAGDVEDEGDVFGKVWAGAKEALRVASFFEMKARAGTAGAQGLGPFLVKLHVAAPNLRVHLIGHSFGARLVSFALSGIPTPQQSPISSLTLIQGAFSCWSFTQERDNPFGKAGALWASADRVAGPLMATFTQADWAVCKWYPAASFLAQQDSEDWTGVGRWNGLGASGYQRVNPSGDITLPLMAGTELSSKTFYRTDANAVIKDTSQSAFAGAHSDIRHAEVAALIVAAATGVAH